jgi:hypothetical protein
VKRAADVDVRPIEHGAAPREDERAGAARAMVDAEIEGDEPLRLGCR